MDLAWLVSSVDLALIDIADLAWLVSSVDLALWGEGWGRGGGRGGGRGRVWWG